MLTAQPSTYDMFALIELFGRKVQSVILHEIQRNQHLYCQYQVQVVMVHEH